jgi:hypothetical protein
LLATIAVGALALLYFSGHASAADVTWDGGGTTNNWSEVANWSGDTVPGIGDVAVFDGTSTKDATIDVNINVQGIQINSGYTGTITQAGSHTITITSNGFGAYTQSGGTFNGGSGDIRLTGDTNRDHTFMLSGGTFNSTSGTLFLSRGFTHNSGSGTFNHNGGTVTFESGSDPSILVPAAGETFNNLNFNRDHGSPSLFLSGRVITVGALALNDGSFYGGFAAGGTLEARAAVTIASTFGGGDVTLALANGSGPRTFVYDVALNLLRIVVNDPNVTINTSGSGTLTWPLGLVLQQGVVNQGDVDFNFFPFPGGSTPYVQSGGTFNGSSNTITFTSSGFGAFTQSGGTFNGGSGDIRLTGDTNRDHTFMLSGGTFNSTSGTLFLSRGFTHNSGSGTFNHNGGTVTFESGNDPSILVPAAGETFNNLNFNRDHGSPSLFLSGKVITVGALALNDGSFYGDFYTGGTLLEARAAVTIASTFGGGDARLIFSGSANQIFTNNGGANLSGTWTINKPSGTVTAASSLILGTSQSLNIEQGTLYLNNGSNLTCGDLTIGSNGPPATVGRLVNDSSTTITLGGSVSLFQNSVVDLQGGGATCPDADTILLRSSITGTRRTWSGAGGYRIVDVDVQDMGGTSASSPAITVFSGTNSGNNGGNWTFDPNCPTGLSISPTVANVPLNGTQTFTAGGGSVPYTFTLAVNNSGATINATTGRYTAGNTPNVTDTVRVTDSVGSTADATVNVTPNLVISGRVTQNGNAIPGGVRVKLSGSSTAQTLTNNQGNYVFSNLPGGGNFTVTPVSPNFDFTPANRTYTNLLSDQTAQDFVAVKNRFTISGNVSSNFEGGVYPLGGVLVTLSGAASNFTTTDSGGKYSFEGPAGSYTVTPTKTGFSMTPASATLTITNQDATANFTTQGPQGLTGRIVFAEFGGTPGAPGIIPSGFIKSMNADGSGLVTLRALGGNSAAFSADGKRIAFARYNGTTSWDIFVSNFDGTNPFNLTNTDGQWEGSPVWSSDGQKIAFVRAASPSDPGSGLFTMNADGTNQTLVSFHLQPPLGRILPTWAPDGTRIAFATQSFNPNVFVVNVDGSSPIQLTNSGQDFSPSWSPNGLQISFNRNRSSLLTVNPDGSNEITVIPAMPGFPILSNAAWSPDSSRIAYVRVNPGTTPNTPEIIVANADGGNQFVAANEITGRLSWAPNAAAATSTGSNVVVQLGGASLTFSGVSQGGSTIVTPISPGGAAGTLPSGFVLRDLAYEIHTTAAVTPPINVCFTVPVSTADTLTDFNRLSILHNEGGVLIDRTTSRTFTTRQICGSVNSLSPFALAEQVNAALPSISGLVLDANEKPMNGVTMHLTGAAERFTQTGIDGIFTFPNLIAGGNYNVEPKQNGFLFTRPNQAFTNLRGNQTVVFAGAAASFTIAGKVRDANGNGVSGVQITIEGGPTPTTTDANGGYSFANVAASDTYFVTPFKPDVDFTPGQRIVQNLSQNQTQVDFTTAAQLQFSAATYSVNENGGSATITVTRTNGSDGAVSVQYATSNGTATAGQDYTATAGTLNFASGETSKTFTVPIADDTTPEPDETINLTLSNPTGGATLGAQSTAVLTIIDNDTSISAVSGSGVYNGTATLTATLTSGSAFLSGETVSFTLNGTAVCGVTGKPSCPTTDSNGVATLSNVSLSGINAGTYPNAVGASFAGDINYTGSNSTGTLSVSKANQTITVGTHAPASAAYNASFTVAATSNSSLAISYSSAGVCTNVGAVFTMTSGTGNCTVKYDQAGNGNYNAAAQVTESVTAQKASQTITFGALANKTFGDADFTVGATASSGLSVSFAASGQCTVSGTTVHITGAGSCTITASQGGNGNYNAAPNVPQSFNIAKAATTTAVSSSVNPSDFGQSVTFNATVTSSAGTPTGTVQFKDGGNNLGSPVNCVAGTNSCSAQVSTAALAAGPHTITAVHSGDANFTSMTGTLTGGQQVNVQTTISINDVQVSEGNSGTTNEVFAVTLAQASNLTVKVDYATANGTATAPADYTAIPTTTLTFAPGETSKSVTVVVNGDTTNEPNETFFVNLTNPVNATISDNQGLGTILNDDAPGFQFEQPSYSVVEGNPSVSIVVKRIGDASNAATVDYATNDFNGVPATELQPAHCEAASTTASSKCDYVTAGGRLRFAAGETSKTVVLSIVDDLYVEGDETLSMTLSNPVILSNQSAGNLVSPSMTVITIQSNDTNQNATGNDNPYLINAFFVRQQYLDFLLREPDTLGFDDWLSVLNNCQPNKGFLGSDPGCDRVHVSSGFFRSPEFGERGYWVYRFFTASLGRRPLYAEFMPEMRRLKGLPPEKPDADLKQDEADFINEFMQRPEFTTIYNGITDAGHASAFIGKLEQKAGVTLPETVPPTQAGQPAQYGRSQLIGLMQNGTLTPAQTLRSFVEQKTVWDAYFFKAFVAMEYFGYLRRDPENAGYDDWVDVLINGRGTHPPGDFRHLVFGFIYSEEYRERFGPR